MTDIAVDENGEPITAAWIVSSLGIDAGNAASLTYVPAEDSIVRGPHSSTVRLDLHGCTAAPSSVFLKRVVPAELSQRSADKWLRDSASYRAEINFSRLWVPLLASKGVRLPAMHAVVAEGVEDLSGLLVDAAAGDAVDDERVEATVHACKFLILSEDLGAAHAQKMLLGEAELRAALEALARFHAATFENVPLLAHAEKELFAEGAYWAPTQRAAAELEALPEAWAALCAELSAEDPALFAQPRVAALGERLRRSAEAVSARLRGGADGAARRCVIHGDFKTANVFFGGAGDALRAVPIDFQWVGVGLGALDVQYLLASSAELGLLADPAALDAALEAYRAALVAATAGRAAAYSLAALRDDVLLALLEYARTVFGYQLKGRDLAWIAGGERTLGRCAHNRSVPHLLWLIRTVDETLARFEAGAF